VDQISSRTEMESASEPLGKDFLCCFSEISLQSYNRQSQASWW